MWQHIIVGLLLFTSSCSSPVDKWVMYSAPEYKMKLPEGWRIEESRQQFISIIANKAECKSIICPNINVVRIRPEGNSLDEVARINSLKNCDRTPCVSSDTESITIDGQQGIKTVQIVKTEGEYVRMEQSYFETDSATIVLISFFCQNSEYGSVQRDFQFIYDGLEFSSR